MKDELLKTIFMCLHVSLCPGIFCVPNKDNLFLLNNRGSDQRHLLADKKIANIILQLHMVLSAHKERSIVTKLRQEMQIKQLLCYLSVPIFLEQTVKTDSTPCFLL